jgi:DNA (cytosine-5)-methyltransferase 1
VVGVDHRPQPHYPYEFHCADALEFPLEGFFVVHASPPCQAYSLITHARPERPDYPDLVEPTRDRLQESGLPYVIENVPGAPLHHPLELCGFSFGLGALVHTEAPPWLLWLTLARHRLFESNARLRGPACAHRGDRVMGVYGDHLRIGARWHANYQLDGDLALSLASSAMGIDWMSWPELTQAIPPAYTHHVGSQLLEVL